MIVMKKIVVVDVTTTTTVPVQTTATKLRTKILIKNDDNNNKGKMMLKNRLRLRTAPPAKTFTNTCARRAPATEHKLNKDQLQISQVPGRSALHLTLVWRERGEIGRLYFVALPKN